jgi:hypothetical protein
MREGLAREVPEAGRALAWARSRLVFQREPVVWAAVSAVGAGFLVGSVLVFVVGLAYRAVTAANPRLDIPPFSPFVTVVGTATSAATALAIGGPVALALELAYVAFGVALRIPGLATFCERSLGGGLQEAASCTPLGFVTSLWPQLVGIGLGLALARTPAVRGSGSNPLLRVAGTLAVTLTVSGGVWGLTVAATASPTTSGLTIAALTVAAAIAAGVVAAQLPNATRNAATVAVVWLLPWVTLQLPLAVQTLSLALPPEFVPSVVAGVVGEPIAAGFLVLSAMVAARSRFIPRAPA